MVLCWISLVLVCLMGLDLMPMSLAQNSQDYLHAHNPARAQVGVSNITWGTTVAACAQNDANSRISNCNLVYSNGNYGENLAKGSGSFRGAAAVNLWVAEEPYYDYNANSCVGGQCLHYTPLVLVQLSSSRVCQGPMHQ